MFKTAKDKGMERNARKTSAMLHSNNGLDKR